ncbi:VOC family protein [Georgenia satyanarayanai]|uniref:VOC family protein n=1 Tax=Georgenia satyanarayanai TaxID=860221 RepID=UPI00203DE930|nr:VOC family protein [Georgenia satyanarayanai]MCM3659557.1 VOC family protein [Georgenia satyanarayanai]
MTVAVTPHLNFRGQARKALEHYRSVFGGEAFAITHADTGRPVPAGEEGDISWGQLVSAAGVRVMVYDVPSTDAWEPGTMTFFVSVRGTDAEEVRGYWEALAADATVLVPLGPAPWAPLYGMLTDPFGVTWVLDVEAAWVSV